MCVFIRWGFNVFLQEGGRVFFSFFLVGGMNSVQYVWFFLIFPLRGDKGRTCGETSIVTLFCGLHVHLREENFYSHCMHACIRVSRSQRAVVIWMCYDVYSSIWGCVLLPLCSSQESPQQEGWCQGKLARLVSYLFPRFHSPRFLFTSLAALPLFGRPSRSELLTH